MAGLRSYTTTAPNVWRFPQWKDHTFYPAGSFVAVAEINAFDSEQVTFDYYVNVTDVPADNKIDKDGSLIFTGGSYSPGDSDSDWINHSTFGVKPWTLTFSTTDASTIAELTANIDALQDLFPLIGIDSDINILYGRDSDLQVQITDNDSDILMEIHDRKAVDSDLQVQIIDNDSDILMEIHDRKAADSDYYVRLTGHLDSEEHARKATDSDLQVQIIDNDSDILQVWHDTLAADSEFDSDLTQFRHDFKADDSDIKFSLDSDLNVLHVRIDSDSDRLVNFIHRYEERDSDIERKFVDVDSDIDYLYANGGASKGNTGFPVGAIQAFAGTTMPFGFKLCDGSTFNAGAYPELFTYLGNNRLPDLRNQFLRGWNNDSDGFGNVRGVLSQQDDEVGPHTHQYTDLYPNNPDGVLDGGTDSAVDGNRSRTLATQVNDGDETRPTNVSVAFGIAMYSGAGIIPDSDILQGIVNAAYDRYDSDITNLYNRTNFEEYTYAPVADTPIGQTFDTGVVIENYDDIQVLLNGVSVTQYSTAGTVFTFNFVIRGSLDEVVIKLRR